jgi:hypothetical protein
MAGSLGVIGDPLKLMSTAYDLFTGASRPSDFEADSRGFLSDTFGQTLGEIIARGVPHALGVDVSHRVGLSNLLEIPSLESYDGKGFLKWLGAAATGASGEDASTMAGGLVKMRQGDIVGGLQAMVPRVLRDPIKAVEQADATTGPSIPAYEMVEQAIGFRPQAVSEYQEGKQAVYAAKQDLQDQRTALVKAWVGADTAGRTDAMSQVQQFNAANPGYEISPAQLFGALRQSRVQAAAQGGFGLRLTPQQLASAGKAGRFANVN